jgi:serine/threonine protein kinase
MECLDVNLPTLLSRGGDDHLLRLKIAAEIARQVAVLHEGGVFHLQLRPTNILFSNTKRTFQFANVGRALVKDEAELLGAPESPNDGSAYAAPELLNPNWTENPAAIDIWSLGVIMYELLTGAPVRPEFATVLMRDFRALVNSRDPKVHEGQEFCLKILQNRQKLSAAQVARDPYLAEIGTRGLGDLKFARSEGAALPVRPERPVFDLLVDPPDPRVDPGFSAFCQTFGGRGGFFRDSVSPTPLAQKDDAAEPPSSFRDSGRHGPETG